MGVGLARPRYSVAAGLFSFMGCVMWPDVSVSSAVPCFGVPRSPHWAQCRADHLAREPACVISGIDKSWLVNVHHIEPYHLRPELELEPTNLITLAEGPVNVHFAVGHGGGSWLDYNPNIRADLRKWRAWWRAWRARIVKGGQ